MRSEESESEPKYTSDSDIEDDLKQGLKQGDKSQKRKFSESESDGGKQAAYKVKKLNPILYEDKLTKAARQSQRDEMRKKNRIANSSYVRELKQDVYEGPEEVVGAAGLQEKS